MGELDKLSPAALSVAMRGGANAWGQHGSIDHVRYMELVPAKSRRRCHCGCKRRATHLGMANGVALSTGCELYIRRWVKDPYKAIRTARASRQGERE